jgi:DMSO/TMAO reductase YedYZ molybdopterin-dependent catalytic subunit
MAMADELESARAALAMIVPEPFNAEAPLEALAGDVTPTELHYVRSNFALPAHDGTLEVGGAVDNPIMLTLDDLHAMPAVERIVTLECARNGRLDMRPLPVGEPWGYGAVSTSRWTGALLRQVLEQAQPTADGVEVRFQGADHGAISARARPAGHRSRRFGLRAIASPRAGGRSGGRNPDRL